MSQEKSFSFKEAETLTLMGLQHILGAGMPRSEAEIDWTVLRAKPTSSWKDTTAICSPKGETMFWLKASAEGYLEEADPASASKSLGETRVRSNLPLVSSPGVRLPLRGSHTHRLPSVISTFCFSDFCDFLPLGLWPGSRRSASHVTDIFCPKLGHMGGAQAG